MSFREREVVRDVVRLKKNREEKVILNKGRKGNAENCLLFCAEERKARTRFPFNFSVVSFDFPYFCFCDIY